MPSPSGSMRSRITAVGLLVSRTAMASRMVATVRTSQPIRRRISASALALVKSSSTSRTVPLTAGDCGGRGANFGLGAGRGFGSEGVMKCDTESTSPSHSAFHRNTPAKLLSQLPGD